MLFDILAFKNDVSFWKNKETMAGMSTRTGILFCVWAKVEVDRVLRWMAAP